MRPRGYGFDLYDSCLACKWRNESFFCQFSTDTLKELDRITFTNVFPEGALLYTEGQPSRGVFLLCHGSAKLSISSGDGKTLITNIARAGQLLGSSSVITGNPYHATATTLEPSQVKFIRREDFLQFLSHESEACHRLAEDLGRQSEADADHIRALGLSHSAAEKLAHLILQWCLEGGTPVENGVRVQMLMTHEDISQMIGTSRETVTRLLKEFRARKLIAIKGSHLTVLNKGALEALVFL